MKFTCPQCNTRYSIADEKVPAAAALRFACKKCGNIIRVRRGEGEAGAPARVASSGDTTRVASLKELEALHNNAQKEKPATPFDTADEWYVLISGEQKGPMSRAQILAMVGRREIDRRAYVWRDGMGEWQRLAVLAAFAEPDAPPASLADPAEGAHQTVMMSATQLGEQLQKTRAQATVAAMDTTQTKIPLRPQPIARSTDTSVAAALDGPPPLSKRRTAELGTKEDGPLALPLGLDDSMGGPSPFNREPSSASTMAAESSEPSFNTPAAADAVAYQNAPPGEATRIFMATAGIYRRRRNHVIAAIAAGVFVLLLIGIAALDVAGIYTIPMMGAVYDLTGVKDPNVERDLARTESKLQASDISAEEREALRKKLLGLKTEAEHTPRPKASGEGKAAKEPVQPTTGIEEKKNLTDAEHSLAADIFADNRKKETSIKLVDPGSIQTPNLPDGLTQEAIFKVINDNTRSMQLCLEEAFKKNDKPPSKMEVQITIAADGSVSNVDIPNAKNSVMGVCTMKRVRGWKFPRFNGEAVTVVFPYVLSTSF